MATRDEAACKKLFLARDWAISGRFQTRICLTLVGVRRRIAAQKFVSPGCDSGRERLPMRVIRYALIAILLLLARPANAQKLREVPRITNRHAAWQKRVMPRPKP